MDKGPQGHSGRARRRGLTCRAGSSHHRWFVRAGAEPGDAAFRAPPRLLRVLFGGELPQIPPNQAVPSPPGIAALSGGAGGVLSHPEETRGLGGQR